MWRRPFLCCRRVAGVREAWPPPGGCSRKSLGFRSCPTPRAAKTGLYSWVSVACVGQVDVFPVGVSDRQALLECVARPGLVGLYEGSFWSRLARPGSS